MEKIKTPAGITVSYETYGTGPPLVLVHGSLNTHMTAWVLAGPLLEAQFTVYAMARRGRGETTATDGHSVEDEAGDLIALLDTIPEPVFLLGHSYGGHVALLAASMAPHKVRKLVVYEAPWPSGLSAGQLAHLQELAAEGDGDGVVHDFLRNTIQFPADILEMIRNSPRWQFLVADAQNSVREWPAMTGLDFQPERFAGLPMPVLLLTGGDSPRDLYTTDALSKVIPNARVTEFPGQGHVAHIFAPQDFVDTVSSFLKE